ncbi:GNAT family N-acetyltransferase [Naumannella halotolerans]|uniref:L-amino acid N-acyltransferase YncA n=1 Tax=Naumannella halotolerans TaxID=993414 RepID=A0A4R7JAD8_9ACTN|nr:GNAT family N-acetyltransferase [Naumannella halotolerans]TDT33513.1 L-amino acid N-acyltransferase YncA [Naumannella halotolerans]
MIPELTDTALDWRPLRASDLEPLAELIEAAEHLDDTAERHDLGQLRRTFVESATDPAEHAVVGWEGDSAIVYGWNHPRFENGRARVALAGVVHPGWRYDKLGRAIFAWQLSRAHAWYYSEGRDAGLSLEAYSDDHLGSRRRLYERNGFTPTRWLSDLHRDLTELDRLPDAVPPPVTLVPFRTELSEQVRLVHHAAFAHQWGAGPIPPEEWERSLRREAARPEWSWVALAGPQVVGYALNSLAPGGGRDGYAEGWTDRIGVHPDWRGSGIARALLRRSLDSFAEAGLDGAGLGADSTEQRLTLYESLGYRPSDTVIQYGRDAVSPRRARHTGS